MKTIFDKLPHVIWNDEPYAKMHDSLPLILFSPENFLSLLEKRYFTEAAYFLPISLSILAYSYKNIGYLTRIYLLQVSLFFLVYYYNEMINCLKVELSETKRTNKHLLFYSKQIVIEFINTLYSDIQLMHEIKPYAFRRNSTGPLEHKFGNC